MKNEFEQKLKEMEEQLGVKITSKQSRNSMFAVVKEKLMEKNSCKEEAIYKILNELETKGIDVKDNVKTIKALISNFLTYVRKGYKGYEGLALIDNETTFQVVKEE